MRASVATAARLDSPLRRWRKHPNSHAAQAIVLAEKVRPQAVAGLDAIGRSA
jgi:hypothetical protein